jgi:protein-disulfide isomerase
LSESSILAAELALAIDDLKTYRQFHTILMEKKSKLNNREIRQAVQSVGLDYDTLKAKSDSTSIKNHIQQNNDLAQALGIQGTPSFFINGVIYEGALSRDEIQSKLNN